MTPRLSIDQLEELKSVMQQMLAEASAANWPELTRLDGERRVILNYPENARELHPSAISEPAISSGQRPFALVPAARSSEKTRVSVPLGNEDNDEIQEPRDERYRSLSQEILEMDAVIRKTIENAKDALLKESRGMKAQVNAKKGYETTNNMTPCSYS